MHEAMMFSSAFLLWAGLFTLSRRVELAGLRDGQGGKVWSGRGGMVLAIGLIVGMTGLLVGSKNVVAMVLSGIGLLLLGCSFLLILVMPKASQLSGEVQWRRIVKHRLQHRLSVFRHAGREWWQVMSRPAMAGGTTAARGRVKRHGPSLEPLLFLAIVLLAGVVALSGMLSTLVRLFDPRNGVNSAIAGTALATAWMVLLGLTLWTFTVTLILAVIVGSGGPRTGPMCFPPYRRQSSARVPVPPSG